MTKSLSDLALQVVKKYSVETDPNERARLRKAWDSLYKKAEGEEKEQIGSLAEALIVVDNS